MASLFRPTWKRAGVTHRSKIWWCQFRNASGVLRRVSLKTASKTAAQLKLADLVREAETGDTRATRRRSGTDVDAVCGLFFSALQWRSAVRH